MNELKKTYMTMQNACGIEVGDTVKVLRKFDSMENGCSPNWKSEIGVRVGTTGTVYEVCERYLRIKFEDKEVWSFPFFVLEKIPKPHWRDTVSPENPVLCYVRDSNHTEWGAYEPYTITGYADCTFKYRTASGGWMQAKRVPKSVIESMLKAYDETSEDE